MDSAHYGWYAGILGARSLLLNRLAAEAADKTADLAERVSPRQSLADSDGVYFPSSGRPRLALCSDVAAMGHSKSVHLLAEVEANNTDRQ